MYRLVLATQPCTFASTTVYRVYRLVLGYTALYTCFNNWLQSVPAGTGYTALYTCFNSWVQSVPAGSGYTALYTCFNNWLQSVWLVLGTQPCTLASTYRLQSLLTLATQSLLYRASPQLVTLKKKKKKKSWLNIDQ